VIGFFPVRCAEPVAPPEAVAGRLGSGAAGAPGEAAPAGGVVPAAPEGVGEVALGAVDGGDREGGAVWLFRGANGAGVAIAAPGTAVVGVVARAGPGAAVPGDDLEPADGAPPVCAKAPPVQMPRATANKIRCMCASLASAAIASATISWANAQFLILFQRRKTECSPPRRRSPDQARIDAMGKRCVALQCFAAGGETIALRAPMRPGAEMSRRPACAHARCQKRRCTRSGGVRMVSRAAWA
jgi:hypothetical protein